MYKLKINGVDIVPTSDHKLLNVHIESDDYSYTFTPNVPTLVKTLHSLVVKSFGVDKGGFNELLKRTK